MVRPFISLNAERVQRDINATCLKLDATLDEVLISSRQAMVEVANDINGEAQSRINNRSGDLSRGATVEEPEVTGTQILVRFGFNKKHARQRDQGGPIIPRNARMLAIPLDPILTGRGVPQYPSPRAEPNLFLLKLWGKLFLARKMGKGADTIELHWLLTDRVDQEGSHFLTGPVQEATPDIPRRIAERVAGILAGGAA